MTAKHSAGVRRYGIDFSDIDMPEMVEQADGDYVRASDYDAAIFWMREQLSAERAGRERAEANAARYEWLRDESNEACGVNVLVPETEDHEAEWRNVAGDDMDAAIDAAISSESTTQKGRG